MTDSELQADLLAVSRDIGRLEAVVDNLRDFIQDSDGEDRSGFKLCLWKCEAALKEGQALHAKITARITDRIVQTVVGAAKP